MAGLNAEEAFGILKVIGTLESTIERQADYISAQERDNLKLKQQIAAAEQAKPPEDGGDG